MRALLYIRYIPFLLPLLYFQTQTFHQAELTRRISGFDDYEVEKYRRFDRSVRPQRQEEETQEQEAKPYWEFYRGDYDSYQEKQNERFILWQKKVGIRPKRY